MWCTINELSVKSCKISRKRRLIIFVMFACCFWCWQLAIKALHVRPDPNLTTQECLLKVSLQPLRLNVDQVIAYNFLQTQLSLLKRSCYSLQVHSIVKMSSNLYFIQNKMRLTLLVQALASACSSWSKGACVCSAWEYNIYLCNCHECNYNYNYFSSLVGCTVFLPVFLHWRVWSILFLIWRKDAFINWHWNWYSDMSCHGWWWSSIVGDVTETCSQYW